ncbi:hypothetical protein DFQ11_1293 [Winogradskyella epiphytica]|uniref:Uncharacterized protein n=1 Tax=Winogradskyella epiphytica TaxID=262005 RepID=A0A2V4XBR8_9FLAO|nr:hypothetical protein [Winogradskyella epiphytica]PYE78494.1 hypothetical protein DFQ11_1293 [Winogradskyella epiphytica]
MKKSIFRTEKIPYTEESIQNYDFNSSTNLIFKNHKTHDNGIARGRKYSLDTVIKFSIFKGYTIKQIIETDFDYFLWFGRKVTNFTYDEKVLNYAEECLTKLINLSNSRIEKFPKLKYLKNQVRLMLKYEHELDFGTNPHSKNGYKLMINVEEYEKIHNKLIEKLIKQYFTKLSYSNEFRAKYLKELKKNTEHNTVYN